MMSSSSPSPSKLSHIADFLHTCPAWVLALFVGSLVAMNLLANKSLGGLPSWLALDAGFLFSWVAFALMDMTVKRFGEAAGNILAFTAIVFNLFIVLIFFMASLLPGEWSASYDAAGQSLPAINAALDQTFAGSWYVVFGSTVAICVSSLFNNRVNVLVARWLHRDNFGVYASRSFISTGLAQFVDNLTFALIVSIPFFGWSLLQAVTCAATGALAELLMEVVFSPVSYRIVRIWEARQTGAAYLEKYVEAR
ncbi:MAG: VUT family protein [Kiritimatiellae bacterium]|nr:VUT family protein [Kiritimatiellia bacterium]